MDGSPPTRRLALVIGGGQSGVDLAGWRAARAAGIATGGSMPPGCWTEDGPRPGYVLEFGAVPIEAPSVGEGYRRRTRMNVERADAVLWIGATDSPGAKTTLGGARDYNKPLPVVVEGTTRPSAVADWIRAGGYGVLDVAGDRESRSPGIGARAEVFLLRVFARLAVYTN